MSDSGGGFGFALVGLLVFGLIIGAAVVGNQTNTTTDIVNQEYQNLPDNSTIIIHNESIVVNETKLTELTQEENTFMPSGNLQPMTAFYSDMNGAASGYASLETDVALQYLGNPTMRLGPDNTRVPPTREVDGAWISVIPGHHYTLKVWAKTAPCPSSTDPQGGATIGFDLEVFNCSAAPNSLAIVDVGVDAYGYGIQAGHPSGSERGWGVGSTGYSINGELGMTQANGNVVRIPWGTDWTQIIWDFYIPTAYYSLVTTGASYPYPTTCNPVQINTFVPWFEGRRISDTAYVWFSQPEMYDLSSGSSSTITASAGSGAVVSPIGSITVNYDGSQTFNWHAATGYVVNQVLIDGAPYGYPGYGSYTFNNVVSNRTISVSAVPQVLTISASSGAHCSITPTGTQSVYYGNAKTFVYSASGGYSVGQVLVDGVSVAVTGSYTFYNTITNHTISVSVFPVTIYFITSSHDAHSTITPDGSIAVSAGTNHIVTYTALAGYSITNVVVDGSAVTITGTYTFSNVNAAHTIDVSATLNTVTITSQSDAHSIISPLGVTTLNHGGSQTYTYQAFAGYQVQQVLVDGQPQQVTGHYTFNALDSNHNITILTNAVVVIFLLGSALFTRVLSTIESKSYDSPVNRDVANPGVCDGCINFRKLIGKI